MIVVDASAMVEVLLRTPQGIALAQRFDASAQQLHAPHLIDAEIAQACRRLTLAGYIGAKTGYEALLDLSVFPITRHPHGRLVLKGWAMRDNFTAYDAIYVALAELLAAPLITRDRRLATAASSRIAVEVI